MWFPKILLFFSAYMGLLRRYISLAAEKTSVTMLASLVGALVASSLPGVVSTAHVARHAVIFVDCTLRKSSSKQNTVHSR